MMAYIKKEPLCAYLENMGVSDIIIRRIESEAHFPAADVVPRAMIAEIFGEIENIARTVGFPETLVNGMIVNRILDGLHLDSQDFAELKKKYIGKDTNVTTNTEN